MGETVPVPTTGLFSELVEVGAWSLRQFWLRLQRRNPLWRYLISGRRRLFLLWLLDWIFNRSAAVGGGSPRLWTSEYPCWIEEFTFQLSDGEKVGSLALWHPVPTAMDAGTAVTLELEGSELVVRLGSETIRQDLPKDHVLVGWSLQVRRRHV